MRRGVLPYAGITQQVQGSTPPRVLSPIGAPQQLAMARVMAGMVLDYSRGRLGNPKRALS